MAVEGEFDIVEGHAELKEIIEQFISQLDPVE